MTQPIRFGTGLSACATAALAAVLVLVAACSPSPQQQEAVPPGTGSSENGSAPAPPDQPVVELPDGFEVTLELAITPEELAQGLMFRPHLPNDRGMLLIFAQERLPSIWMMNTLIALDLVYLDHAGTVVDVIPNAQPCPGEPCPRYVPRRPAQVVLELPAGSAAAHSVADGAQLRFERVPDYPTGD
jgi:uncharacterized membrane protein (UPF0127 family)